MSGVPKQSLPCFPDVLFTFCAADVRQLRVWTAEWRRKLETQNQLCLFRVNNAHSQSSDKALGVHCHSRLLRLFPAWSPRLVTDSIYPRTVLAWHTSSLGYFFILSAHILHFSPISNCRGSVFPSSTTHSWGGHHPLVVPLYCDHDCCHYCRAPSVWHSTVRQTAISLAAALLSFPAFSVPFLPLTGPQAFMGGLWPNNTGGVSTFSWKLV